MSDLIHNVEELIHSLRETLGTGVVWKDKYGLRGLEGLSDEFYYHGSPYCVKVKENDSCSRKCAENVFTLLTECSKEKTSPFFHHCHAGCAELVFPIMDDDQFDGLLLIGPFKTPEISCAYPRANREFRELELLDETRLNDTLPVIRVVAVRLEELKLKQEREGRVKRISHPKILAATELIAKLCPTPISASRIAEDIDLSASRFVHLFKEETGESFTSYVIRSRMEIAKRLLKETRLDIHEVSLSSGYSEQCYFGAVFKKVTGLTPSQYRKRHRP